MWFPADKMPLGRAMWALIIMALVGVIAIVGASGWLLILYIAQHVRFV